MRNELHIMESRVMSIMNAAFQNYPIRFFRVRQKCGGEMYNYKVKLENMFSDTDETSEKVEIITTLLQLEFVFGNGESDDYDRYIRLALQTEQTNAYFHYRNRDITFLLIVYYDLCIEALNNKSLLYKLQMIF